jgi:hypothetical protein
VGLPRDYRFQRIRRLAMVQHHRDVIVLERYPQCLQRLRRPLGIRSCIQANQLKIETANQVAEMIAQAHHTQIVGSRQTRLVGVRPG